MTRPLLSDFKSGDIIHIRIDDLCNYGGSFRSDYYNKGGVYELISVDSSFIRVKTDANTVGRWSIPNEYCFDIAQIEIPKELFEI